jgi:hypothetical protein
MSDDDVPKLPRGKGLTLRGSDLVRIGMFATLLVCILALGQPCADGVSGFVESFAPPDATPAGAPAEMQLERLSDEEIRRRFPETPDEQPAEQPEEAAPEPRSPADPGLPDAKRPARPATDGAAEARRP